MQSQSVHGNAKSDLIWEEDWSGGLRPGLGARVRAALIDQNIPRQGREYVRQTIKSPSRRVKSTPKSSSGIYPSRKLGVTVGFESRTLELAAILALEHDEDTIAFFDQPQNVPVEYFRGGRKRVYRQTPDYMRVKADGVTLIECKPLAKIAQRNDQDPGFYVNDGSRWVCPALQASAASLGFRHEVWTEESFSVTWLRNIRMLSDYMVASEPMPGYQEALAATHRVLQSKVRITIEALQDVLRDDICIDHVYSAIGRGDITLDLNDAPLVEPQRCHVFRDPETMRAYQRSALASISCNRQLLTQTTQVSAGTRLKWDGVHWRCVNFGSKDVLVQHDNTFEAIPRSVFDQLVLKRTITVSEGVPTDPGDTTGHLLLAKASASDLRTANLRHARVLPYLAQGARAPQARTLRRYLASYRNAERVHGNGYIGLLPGYNRSGNRAPRHVKEVLDIVLQHVRQHYQSAANKHAKAVFTLIADECTAKALPTPSYSWFCKFLKKIPAYVMATSRKGSKGAYALEPRQDADAGVDNGQPERPWERAHIDHTLIDVETIFSETGENLGRCWLTVMIDHDSRKVLAFYLTFDPPSYRSLLMVLRKCVQRHGRLPDSIVVDGGKEFQSAYFETVCALYRIQIVRRPTSKGRYGSQCERIFGTINTNLLHFLQGNTQLRKNVRQMSESVDPNVHAVWTLPALNKALERYLFEVYDTLVHRELLVAPRFAFDAGLQRHGQRPIRLIAYNELFIVLTSPTTSKGTAKVQCDGVKINYIYYNHPQLQQHLGKSVEVRYDPFNKAQAWAFANGQWLKLRSRHDRLLCGFTEHDLDLAAAEWKKRRSDVEKARLSEPVLVKFLKEILNTETLLLARRRAAEERRVRDDDSSADHDERQPLDVGDPAPQAIQSAPAHADTRSAFDQFNPSDIELLEAL